MAPSSQELEPPQNPGRFIPIFSAVIKQLAESYKTKEKKLFERAKFRGLMKQLNLKGGVTLLGALNSEQLESIVEECAK